MSLWSSNLPREFPSNHWNAVLVLYKSRSAIRGHNSLDLTPYLIKQHKKWGEERGRNGNNIIPPTHGRFWPPIDNGGIQLIILQEGPQTLHRHTSLEGRWNDGYCIDWANSQVTTCNYGNCQVIVQWQSCDTRHVTVMWHTCTMLEMRKGSMTRGKRRILNSERATKALSAVNFLSGSSEPRLIRVKVAKVTRAT